MQHCSVINKKDLGRELKPALDKFVEVNEIDHGEIVVRAKIHNGRISFVSISDEESFKFC